MRSCEGYKLPSEYDLRELDRFRSLTEHREIATARAMDYCVKYQIYPPEWLVVEAASLLMEWLKRERPAKRGRTASCLSRFQHEMWDVERWDAVKTVREIRERCKREEKALKDLPEAAASGGRKRQLLKLKKWLSQGTLACAAKLLVGRYALASPSAVNASYKKMEATRRSKPPAGAWFDDPFMKELGFQESHERTTGKNMFEIFDLT